LEEKFYIVQRAYFVPYRFIVRRGDIVRCGDIARYRYTVRYYALRRTQSGYFDVHFELIATSISWEIHYYCSSRDNRERIERP
jgi:hypothetical protein